MKMNKFLVCATSLVAVFFLTSSDLLAQRGVGRPSNISRPTVSPYLNLFNRGGSFSQNYFNQVRPQLQFRREFNQQQRALNRQGAQLNQLRNAPAQSPANTQSTSQSPTSGLNITGHSTSFLSTGSYFPGQ